MKKVTKIALTEGLQKGLSNANLTIKVARPSGPPPSTVPQPSKSPQPLITPQPSTVLKKNG